MDRTTLRGLARHLTERTLLIEDTDKRTSPEDGPQPPPYTDGRKDS
jgi:hypothetical protein